MVFEISSGQHNKTTATQRGSDMSLSLPKLPIVSMPKNIEKQEKFLGIIKQSKVVMRP